jgi:hypothetical protein
MATTGTGTSAGMQDRFVKTVIGTPVCAGGIGAVTGAYAYQVGCLATAAFQAQESRKALAYQFV